MIRLRWLLLAPLLAIGLARTAPAAEILDSADLFGREAVRQAQETLDKIDRQDKIPVRIETIKSLRDATSKTEQAEWKDKKKTEVINLLAKRKYNDWGSHGLYVLIAKDNQVVSNVLVPDRLGAKIPADRRVEIRDTIAKHFKTSDFDGGLRAGVDEIQKSADKARQATSVPAPKGGLPGPGGAMPGPGANFPNPNPKAPIPIPQQRPQAPNGGFRMPSIFGLIVLVLVIFLVFRLIGAIFGARSRGYGQSMPMGGPGGPPPGYGGGGYGPGGPGYGGGGYGPGYGGRPGGGFLSGMFGGLGGALLGNWAYDRFGRSSNEGHYPAHHEDPGAYPTPPVDPNYGSGSDEPVGGQDDGGQGASWGGGGEEPGGWLSGGDSGGDTGGGGGGDWGGGGGDSGGGGGDWGGGGGDAGGGGGDWGGGGGGGDGGGGW